MSDTTVATGQYVYCIIRCPQHRQLRAAGLGGRDDVVHTLHFRDLAAVVSDSPQDRYQQTRQNMLGHTVVLEEVMGALPLLPVRFGTVAPNAEAVTERLLKQRYEEFGRLLGEMDGMVELGLKALWREEVLFEEIVEANPDIRHLRDSLSGRPAPATHFGRMRLGEMVENAINAKRYADAQALLARLKPLAEQSRENALIGDRMVLNGAFLVPAEREAAFDHAIEQIDAEMGARMILKYVGPTPPYNFVNITVTWGQ